MISTRNGLLSAALLAVGLLVSAQPGHASDDNWRSNHRPWHEPSYHIVKFDVAEEHKRFFFDEAPVLDNGFPAAGNAFITEGYIYPYGFLNGRDGTLPDGGPSHPEKVIGRWICRGYFIGDGAATTSGPWVSTTQYYEFGDKAGQLSLNTEGLELADLDKPIRRAITGGTGKFRNARGQALQTLIGFQATEAVKLRFEIKVKR